MIRQNPAHPEMTEVGLISVKTHLGTHPRSSALTGAHGAVIR